MQNVNELTKRIKICQELRKQGFSYSQISQKIGCSISQVNYYLHHKHRKAQARNYARRRREEYRTMYPPPTKPTREEVIENFKSYRARHDVFIQKVAEQLKGEAFLRSPFDVVAPNGDFYEVKVTNEIRPHMIQGSLRFQLSETELKFMEMVKERYHIVLIHTGNKEVRAWLIHYDKLEKWNNRLKLRKGSWRPNMLFKIFELSKKRLNALRPFHFEQN